MELKNNKKLIIIPSLFIVLFLIGFTIDQQNSEAIKPLQYDGTQPMITFKFDHAFSSQSSAIANMSKYGIVGDELVVTDKVGKDGFMKWNQIDQLKKSGWEIVSHSQQHIKELPTTPIKSTKMEVIGSLAVLNYHGFNVTGYASPADSITPNSEAEINPMYKYTVIAGCKLNSLDSISHDGSNYGFTIPVIHHCGLSYSGSPLISVVSAESMIDTAIKNKQWLVITFHDLNNSHQPDTTPPEWFDQVFSYVQPKIKNVEITSVTTCQGLGIC